MEKEKILIVKQEMEYLLRTSKNAIKEGAFEEAERKDIKVFAMERTLKLLGYSVTIDTEKSKVNIS